jgi:CRP-like cAMP-binding protein
VPEAPDEGASTGFLGALAVDDRTALLTAARRRTYPAGSVMLFEGDAAHDVVLVADGHVKVTAVIDDHEVLLDVVGPGALLGELAALDGTARSAQATALTRVRAWSLPADTFSDLVADRPLLALAVLRDVTGRLRGASQRQAEHGGLDGTGRVCRRLVELMAHFGHATDTGVLITGPLTQGDIAAWAGLSREAVVKAFQALRRIGWVATTARSITVLDVAAVRARAALPR